MALYEVLGGKHHHHGKTYGKGEIVESDSDLERIFRNKFRKVGEVSHLGKKAGKKKAGKKVKIAGAKKRKADASAENARGVDVSENFPTAQEAGYEVFRRGKIHHVYEKGETSPLNEEGLKESKVEAFVAELLEQ